MTHDQIILPHGYEPRVCGMCARFESHPDLINREDPATIADRAHYYRVTAQARAEGRPRTYAELFGDN